MPFEVILDGETRVWVAVEAFQDDTVEVVEEVRFVLYTEDVIFCNMEIYFPVPSPFFKLLGSSWRVT